MNVFPMNIRWVVADVVDAILLDGARRATKYLSPQMVISAARPFYKKAPWNRRDKRVGIVLKIGQPNFEEREFIAKRKKAGFPFPVKEIQLKFPPARKDR